MPGLHPDVVCGGETAGMLCEVMMLTHCCGSCLVGHFGGACPGVGFIFTYHLAYAAGYGLRSY